MNGARLTLWWVDRYTRGVPDAARKARRAEMRSDLWEHRAAHGAGPGVELAVLSRCIRGIPADLAWRRSRRRKRRPTSLRGALRVTGWSLACLAYVFLVATHGYGATALVGFDFYGGDWAPGDVVDYARINGVLLALLVAGGALLRRRPRLAVGLLVAATTGACVVFWWAAPIYGPMGLSVVTGAVVLTRRRRAAG